MLPSGTLEWAGTRFAGSGPEVLHPKGSAGDESSAAVVAVGVGRESADEVLRVAAADLVEQQERIHHREHARAKRSMQLHPDTVADFLEKNRKYEVLGLFILLIVGVVLLGEGGHEAGLTLFGYPVEAMSKSTFYFSVAVLVAVDVIQSGYEKKLEVQGAPAPADAG